MTVRYAHKEDAHAAFEGKLGSLLLIQLTFEAVDPLLKSSLVPLQRRVLLVGVLRKSMPVLCVFDGLVLLLFQFVHLRQQKIDMLGRVRIPTLTGGELGISLLVSVAATHF